jgi:hypothetical protein
MQTWNTTFWPWIDWLMYSAIPCTFLVVLNTFIVVTNKRSVRVQKRMIQDRQTRAPPAASTTRGITFQTRTNQERQHTQLTRMMMAVTINMIVCTTPRAVFMNVIKNGFDMYADVPSYMLFLLIMLIARICRGMNHALNFYLYFISGRKFRKQCLDLICFCRRRPAISANKRITSKMSTAVITRHSKSRERVSENNAAFNTHM